MPKLGSDRRPGDSPYQALVRNWTNCTRCPLHEARKHVCIVRGAIPADVLFIGEAPGESEDVLGRPFVGPAGQLLDTMILKALEDSGLERDFGPGPAPKMAWTNLVGCVPKDGNSKRKRGEPLPPEIVACKPRLDRLIELTRPKLIVAVGVLAEKEAKKQNWHEIAPVLGIYHPSYLLRLDVSSKTLTIQRVIVQLSDAFAEHLAPGT